MQTLVRLTGHKNHVAQPKADKCPSSVSHFITVSLLFKCRFVGNKGNCPENSHVSKYKHVALRPQRTEIRVLCFVPINSVLLNFLYIWNWYGCQCVEF